MPRVIPSAPFVAFVALSACVPTPRAPVDLRTAEAKVIRFGLASGQGSVCPGSAVPVDVQLEAELDGDGDRVHVFQHRRDIDDRIFDLHQLHLSSPHGSFDDNGVFHASRDVLATAQSGFVLNVRAPRGPSFSVRYPPAYECAPPVGGEGAAGIDGAPGADAILGESAGGAGGVLAGGGRPGQAGGKGSAGPKLTVFVTWVRSPDYTRLLAARAVGDVPGLTLAAPGTTLPILARGGPGGIGGRGGRGAFSVDGRQSGGPGGMGGEGGEGGDGGQVELVLDPRFDELERWVSVDVEGGVGGRGGFGGTGGGEGRRADVAGGPAYDYGSPGPPGTSGAQGRPGEAGRAVVRKAAPEEVERVFANLGPLVRF